MAALSTSHGHMATVTGRVPIPFDRHQQGTQRAAVAVPPDALTESRQPMPSSILRHVLASDYDEARDGAMLSSSEDSQSMCTCLAYLMGSTRDDHDLTQFQHWKCVSPSVMPTTSLLKTRQRAASTSSPRDRRLDTTTSSLQARVDPFLHTGCQGLDPPPFPQSHSMSRSLHQDLLRLIAMLYARRAARTISANRTQMGPSFSPRKLLLLSTQISRRPHFDAAQARSRAHPRKCHGTARACHQRP